VSTVVALTVRAVCYHAQRKATGVALSTNTLPRKLGLLRSMHLLAMQGSPDAVKLVNAAHTAICQPNVLSPTDTLHRWPATVTLT
jgi:hypothetical protein